MECKLLVREDACPRCRHWYKSYVPDKPRLVSGTNSYLRFRQTFKSVVRTVSSRTRIQSTKGHDSLLRKALLRNSFCSRGVAQTRVDETILDTSILANALLIKRCFGDAGRNQYYPVVVGYPSKVEASMMYQQFPMMIQANNNCITPNERDENQSPALPHPLERFCWLTS